MEKYLVNLDVWCWKYLENIRNYPGLHLTAKPEACDALLRCLDTIQQQGDGAMRSVPLKPLTKADEAKVTGGRAYECFQTLRFIFRQEGPELRYLCVSAAGSLALIEVTNAAVDQLRGGIEDVKRGCGDYSIAPPRKGRGGPDLGDKDLMSTSLWFWPCFGHLHPTE